MARVTVRPRNSPRSLSYRQIHDLFQSEFSNHEDLMLHFGTSSIFYFLYGFPVGTDVFFPVFPSLLSLPHVFSSIRVSEDSSYQDVTSPVRLPSFYFDSGLLHPSPAPHFKTFQLLLIYFPKCPKSLHHKKLCSQM